MTYVNDQEAKAVENNAAPFFSVVLFTKGRPEPASFALRSVLRQSFLDFEVIICDNNESEETQNALKQYRDPRIRYHRTGGLSMPANWDKGLSLARGKYVMSLTDRAVLKSYSLSRVHRAILEHAVDVVIWSYNLHDSRGDTDHVSYPTRSQERIVPSAEIFEGFQKKPYFDYTDNFPKNLNSCHSRALLERIRTLTGGHCCLPVTVDHNLAFLTLALCPKFLILAEPLFVWGALHLSNGGGTYRESPTFLKFLSDLGLTTADLYTRVPVKTVGVHNMVCNDFLKLKAQYPTQFESFELDWASYFATCYDEPSVWLQSDEPLFAEKRARWEAALQLQPRSLQKAVRTILRKRISHPTLWSKVRPIVKKLIPAPVRSLKHRFQPRPPTTPLRNTISRPKKFRDILEVLDWVERSEANDPGVY